LKTPESGKKSSDRRSPRVVAGNARPDNHFRPARQPVTIFELILIAESVSPFAFERITNDNDTILSKQQKVC